MEKMWAGRTEGAVDKKADDFNSSIHIDCAMYKEDIKGSMAHAFMLAERGILPRGESNKIIDGLASVLEDIESGALAIDMSAEDIHMFVEAELTKRIGDAGKRLHTARSRNDQVALDTRMYLRSRVRNTKKLIFALISAVLEKANAHKNDIMPGYTHLQRAQPVTFGHHLLAYAMMLLRDAGRFEDASARMNFSPLGSCALAGTTYPIDREMTAERLGFDGIAKNSIDGVSDRDFCVELACAASLLMTHLSRFAEEIILWSSWEFKFTELDDAFTTGSSIMPQKKNPDMAELVRGKTGRVYGDLISLLTMLKGLPLAYNKDMQEDKEAVFDAFNTVDACLEIFAPMISTLRALPENMYRAAQKGFINATDLADYLVKKGLPFRSAYKVSGKIVSYCIENDKVLEDLSIEEYKSFEALFENDLYDAISLKNCVARRISAGGAAPESVDEQIKYVTEYLENEKNIY